MNSSKYSEAIKMMNSDKPKIRFKGFEEAWSKKSLGEIGNTFTGLSGKTKDDFGHGQASFITYMNIFSNPITDKNLHEPIEIDNKQTEVQIGDVFFTTSSETPEEVGMSSVLLEKDGITYLNSFCFGFRPHIETDPFYLAYLLRSFSIREQIIKLAQGISRYNISKTKMMSTSLTFPSLSEQEKIGKLFKRIDTLLNLQQRKCDKLKVIKKAMRSKMFPKPGKKAPEVRFQGFTDDWVECKLGEIAEIKMGQSPSGNTYSTTPSKYILVQGNSDLINGWVCPRVWTTQITQQANAGDLIMSVRAPAGQMGKTAYDVVIGRGVAAIKGNEFIFQSLAKMNDNNYWKHLSCGSTFESLNSENIKMAALSIPSKKEQQKIGKLFERIDHLISLNDLKLSKLRLIKRSLLEDMFV